MIDKSSNIKIIEAVLNMDVDTFKHYIRTKQFDTSLLVDTQIMEEYVYPIQWITQCWEIAFENIEEYSDECREFVQRQKEKNSEIKRIFEEELSVSFVPIDFDKTEIYSSSANQAESFDEFYENTREDMLSKGYRGIDLNLMMAVCKFDYAETKRLLDQTANPKCHIKEIDDNSLSFIKWRSDSLFFELKYIIIGTGEPEYEPDLLEKMYFLFGYASCCKMERLINEYL